MVAWKLEVAREAIRLALKYLDNPDKYGHRPYSPRAVLRQALKDIER